MEQVVRVSVKCESECEMLSNLSHIIPFHYWIEESLKT